MYNVKFASMPKHHATEV